MLFDLDYFYNKKLSHYKEENRLGADKTKEENNKN
jgi:hypothetical protein